MENEANKEPRKELGIGDKLRLAREKMKKSQDYIAKELRISKNIIEKIEIEDFYTGPSIIFMRGYIRNYAKLVNLPEEEVEQAVASLQPKPYTVPEFAISKQTSICDNKMRWATGIIALVILGSFIIWWHNKQSKEAPTAIETTVTTETVSPVSNVSTTPPSQVPEKPAAEVAADVGKPATTNIDTKTSPQANNNPGFVAPNEPGL